MFKLHPIRAATVVVTSLLLFCGHAEARNIVTTADGIAIATSNANGSRRSLVTYDSNRSSQTIHRFSNLPSSIRGFDDVAVDPNALARDSTIAFAIDANSGLVCSFNLSSQQAGGVSLELIGCTTQSVRTAPFVGIAALQGRLVVSGGTGGVSIFSYNTNTGRLATSPTIRNRDLGEIGHPGVTMVSRNIAALCTDAERGGFGITVANIRRNARSLDRARFFRVQNTVDFDYTIRPANFPCDSSMYVKNRGTRYLFVANGPITVQDPRRNKSPTVITAVPNGFEALSVDVNSERSIAVFGGVIENGERSAYVVLNISDPLNPKFVNMEIVQRNGRGGSGRITGVASAGRNIMYVFDDDLSSIGHDRVQSLLLENSEVAEEIA